MYVTCLFVNTGTHICMCVTCLCNMFTLLGLLMDKGCVLGLSIAPARFHSGSVSSLNGRLTGFSWVFTWRNGLRSRSFRSILRTQGEQGLLSRSARNRGEQALLVGLEPGIRLEGGEGGRLEQSFFNSDWTATPSLSPGRP